MDFSNYSFNPLSVPLYRYTPGSFTEQQIKDRIQNYTLSLQENQKKAEPTATEDFDIFIEFNVAEDSSEESSKRSIESSAIEENNTNKKARVETENVIALEQNSTHVVKKRVGKEAYDCHEIQKVLLDKENTFTSIIKLAQHIKAVTKSSSKDEAIKTHITRKALCEGVEKTCYEVFETNRGALINSELSRNAWRKEECETVQKWFQFFLDNKKTFPNSETLREEILKDKTLERPSSALRGHLTCKETRCSLKQTCKEIFDKNKGTLIVRPPENKYNKDEWSQEECEAVKTALQHFLDTKKSFKSGNDLYQAAFDYIKVEIIEDFKRGGQALGNHVSIGCQFKDGCKNSVFDKNKDKLIVRVPQVIHNKNGWSQEECEAVKTSLQYFLDIKQSFESASDLYEAAVNYIKKEVVKKFKRSAKALGNHLSIACRFKDGCKNLFETNEDQLLKK